MRVTSVQDRLRVLLIEDGKGDAKLVMRSLDAALPESNIIVAVETIEEAVKQLAKKTFDVALLDRSLPDVEGFSGLHSLQSFAPELPIVFLTAYKDEQTAMDGIAQGAQDYLFKDNLDGHVIKRAIQYAILRKQFEGVLIMRANFDMLTGLFNRTLFESRLDMAIAKMRRHGGALAVLFLDLDGFKSVNDTLGHAAGDEILKQAAARMKRALRPYDTLARFGGDEFAVLLENLPDIAHSETVAKKILSLMSPPFQVCGQVACVGVSIGIATCVVGQSVSREELLKQADAAMYAAKAAPGTYSCFLRSRNRFSDEGRAIQI